MRFSAARLFAALFFVPGTLLAFDAFLPACRAGTPPVQDVFAGNGTPGPFALSWNHLPTDTETVSVNGQQQARALDYALDADAGTVTFTHSLPTGAAVSILYSISPQSQRSGTTQSIPVTLDLMRNPHGYFSLDALGRASVGTSNSLTLGASLGWHGAGSDQVSCRFLDTTPTASDANADADRAGLSLSAAMGAGRWGLFSLGFSRAGDGLDTGGDSAFQSGHQLFTLGSTLNPSKAVQAKLSFSRSDALDGTGAAPNTSDAAALTVTPVDKTIVQAALAQTSTGPGGTTQTAALFVTMPATKTVSVSAGFNDQTLPGAATVNQQSVALVLTSKSSVHLNAGFSRRQKSGGGTADAVETSEAAVGGTLHPLSLLTVSGSYKSRLAPAGDIDPSDLFDTSTAQVAFTPLKTLTLTGTYAQNPDDAQNSNEAQNLSGGTATVQRLARRGIGLETSVGALGLSGGYDWSRTYGTPDVEETIHAALGLRFSKATQLSVGYQAQQNLLDDAAPLATVYTVGFTHTLSDRFSLSLSGKRQQAQAAASPDYNATANLGVKF